MFLLSGGKLEFNLTFPRIIYYWRRKFSETLKLISVISLMIKSVKIGIELHNGKPFTC